MIVCDLQLVSWMVSFMAFLMMWYVDSSIFYYFWSFLERKPPCLDAWFVSVGIDGAVHVSSINFDMLLTIRSICLHMSYHWFMGSFVLVFRMFVSCCIWIVFVSENFIRNLLMFSGGMGFSIFGLLLFGMGKCVLAMMQLGGMYRFIG
jgi:hypothetical protein